MSAFTKAVKRAEYKTFKECMILFAGDWAAVAKIRALAAKSGITWLPPKDQIISFARERYIRCACPADKTCNTCYSSRALIWRLNWPEKFPYCARKIKVFSPSGDAVKCGFWTPKRRLYLLEETK